MSQLALYRKYRSQTFEDLVGQDHVIKTLRNSIASGRISHAYLFTGPRGTGKTSTARLLAKALNCTGGPSAEIPDDCPICAEISAGNCMDVIELDAASESGVDDIRTSVIQAADYQPTHCRYKVYIIDEVHDLSAKAFDALLKTIEEPPGHVIFILATTEYNKVPPTIRSRCQKFDFHRGSIEDLTKRLEYVAAQEQVEAEPGALSAIARLADGGFRDALTLLEQALITSEGTVTLAHVYDQLGLVADEAVDQLIGGVAEGDTKLIITSVEEIYRQGRDPRSIVESLMHRLSDLTRAMYEISVGEGVDKTIEAGLMATAKRIGAEKLLAIRSELAETHKVIRDVSLPRLWLEANFIRISQLVNGKAPVAQVVAPAPVASTPKPETKPAPVYKPVAKDSPPAAVTQPTAVRETNQENPQPAQRREEIPMELDVAPNPELPAESETWTKVVKAMCDLSRTAAMRLPKGQVYQRAGNKISIAFERMSDADWVNDRPKLRAAIAEEWRKLTSEDFDFEFVVFQNGTKPKSAPKIETASVELALEGEDLAKAGREIFLSGTHENNES